MKCTYCNKELKNDEPHIKEHHHEFGEYRMTRYFCTIECQVMRVLTGRYGYQKEAAEKIVSEGVTP